MLEHWLKQVCLANLGYRYEILLSPQESIVADTQALRLIPERIASLKSTMRYDERQMLKLFEVSDFFSRKSLC